MDQILKRRLADSQLARNRFKLPWRFNGQHAKHSGNLAIHVGIPCRQSESKRDCGPAIFLHRVRLPSIGSERSRRKRPVPKVPCAHLPNKVA